MLKTRFALLALAVVALTAAGCGEGSTGNAIIDARNQVDTAYEAVAAAQIAQANAYSNAILKTTSDPEIKKFAQGVLDERKVWSGMLDRMRKTGGTVTIPKASHTLDMSLNSLGVTADGTPKAAPSTDAGYLTAMKANNKAAIKAAQVDLDNGGPGTSQLANRTIQGATQEQENIKQLQQ